MVDRFSTIAAKLRPFTPNGVVKNLNRVYKNPKNRVTGSLFGVKWYARMEPVTPYQPPLNSTQKSGKSLGYADYQFDMFHFFHFFLSSKNSAGLLFTTFFKKGGEGPIYLPNNHATYAGIFACNIVCNCDTYILYCRLHSANIIK